MNQSPNNRNQPGFDWMGILIIAIIVLAGLAAYIMLRGEKKETIKIGAILPLTGAGEWLGTEARDGMLLAADQINSRNGVNGREIELIIEDSKTDPQEGKKTFNKIEKTYHPLLYVSVLSNISEAMAPLSEENSAVLFGLMTSSTGFTEGKEWIFRYYVTAEVDALPILSILQKLKVKNLGIIYINDEYGVSVFEIVKKGFQESGGTIKSEPFEIIDMDYKERILKLKDMEAICFIGFVPHIEKAFKQLREVNYKGSILAAGGASDPNVTSMPEASGVYVSAPVIYDPNYVFAKEAKKKYEARYSKPFNTFAATGYDFLIFIAGLLQDREISRDNVKFILEEGFIHPGVFGVLDVKPGEHDISFPFHPARIVNGELKYLNINH
jgi:branched-chain amino acid transport system substrate-binding protein